MQIVTEDILFDNIGKETGKSDWLLIDQERINNFADTTIDHQFIHVDDARAAKSLFGGTVAHGFLTLSLLSHFAQDSVLMLEGAVMGVNYGMNKVRFLNPVICGQRIRGVFVLSNAVKNDSKKLLETDPDQFLMTYNVKVEIEGEVVPAMIAEWLIMQMRAPT